MSITFFLRKIMGLFFEPTYLNSSITRTQIENIIKNFSDPIDDIERSTYQYFCTMKGFGNGKSFLINIASAVVFIPYFIKMRITNVTSEGQSYDAVYLTGGGISTNIIPQTLKDEFRNIISVEIGKEIGKHMSLSANDVIFLKKIWKRRPLSFYFNLKLMMKIAIVSYGLRKYHPKAIISWTESSFATSLISYYCEKQGIQNIGIMHGNREFSLKLAFFRCSRYYAWDEDYVNLFKSMRCEATQFHIEIPDAIKMPNYKRTEDPQYDYTFYLQVENDISLKRLRQACTMLLQDGKKVSIRPHPRADHPSLKNMFLDINIQRSENITLEQSFSNTKIVVAKCSTVLYQAWYQNIPIVIDDYTVPGLYERSCDLHAVELMKPHQLLSEILFKNQH